MSKTFVVVARKPEARLSRQEKKARKHADRQRAKLAIRNWSVTE
jgi:hypothetical protein